MINSIKDLESVIKLCRKTGVEHIIISGIEINLGPQPMAYKREKPKYNAKALVEHMAHSPGVAYTPDETSQITADDILTPEQMLFYSSQPIEG